MTYNEQADSERERDAAAYMMQAVRLSLPLVDSVGETKVWETGSVVEERKTRMWPLVIILLIVAIVLCGVGLLPLVMDLGGIEKVDYVKQGPMLLGGLAAAFIAGLLPRRSAPKKTKAGQRVETNIDPNKVYISFRNALLAVDQNLEEIQSMQRWEKREEAGKIDGHVVSDPQAADRSGGLQCGNSTVLRYDAVPACRYHPACSGRRRETAAEGHGVNGFRTLISQEGARINGSIFWI